MGLHDRQYQVRSMKNGGTRSNSIERVVSVEIDWLGRVDLSVRNGEHISKEERRHRFWMLLDDQAPVDGNLHNAQHRPLASGDLRHLVTFDTPEGMREYAEEVGPSGCYHIRAWVQQYMVASGVRQFRGMRFDELRRLQLDLEIVHPDDDFPESTRPGDRIVVAVLRDSTGWEEVLHCGDMSEEELVQRVIDLIKERDPDVVEAHSAHSHVLSYLLLRAQRLGVDVDLGRGGYPFTMFTSRLSAGTSSRTFDAIHLPGRHIVDTEFLIARHDVPRRHLRSHRLAEAVSELGIDADMNLLTNAEDAGDLWSKDREKLIARVRERVRCVAEISSRLLPTYFELAKLVPVPFEMVTTVGPGKLVELLLVSAVLAKGHGIPVPLPKENPSTGGAIEIFSKGIHQNVVYADVASLYPSVMLAEKIAPIGDTAGVFLSTLEKLTKHRGELKRKAREATDPDKSRTLNARQEAFKRLLVSFSGHLSSRDRPFNDPSAYERVVSRGREIAYLIVDLIKQAGGRPIQLNTDGVYFVLPDTLRTADEARAFVQRISDELPGGIVLEFEGRWPAMLSVTRGNFALLDDDGGVELKGSALHGADKERFTSEFLFEALPFAATGNAAELRECYLRYREIIIDHQFPIEKITRCRRLKQTVAEYRRSVSEDGEKQPHYELLLRNVTESEQPDIALGRRVPFYFRAGEKNQPAHARGAWPDEWNPEQPDEDVDGLLKTLSQTAEVLGSLFSKTDFEKIFRESSDDNDGGLVDIRIIEPVRAGPIQDYMPHEEHSERIMRTMLELIEAGYSVVPLKGKKPLEKGYLTKVLTPAYVEGRCQFWKYRSRQSELPFNYGILTGPKHDLVVLDVDAIDDPRGIEAFIDTYLRDSNDDGWDVYTRTGSGNLHVYYRHQKALTNKVVQLEVDGSLVKVEIKGAKLKVVGPGSVHAETGGHYDLRYPPAPSGDALDLPDILDRRLEIPPDLLTALKSAKPFKGRTGNSSHAESQSASPPLFATEESVRDRLRRFRDLTEPYVEPGNVRDIVNVARRHNPCPDGFRNRDLSSFAGSAIRFIIRDYTNRFHVFHSYSACFHHPPLNPHRLAEFTRSSMNWSFRSVSLKRDIILILKNGPMAERWITANLMRDRKVVRATIKEMLEDGKIYRKPKKGRNSKLYLRRILWSPSLGKIR